jgi:hypothetical protein
VILSGCTCIEVVDEGVEAVAGSLEAIGCDVLTVVEKCLELIRRAGTAVLVGVGVAGRGWDVVEVLLARKRDVE